MHGDAVPGVWHRPLTRISHQLTVEARDRPAITSLRLLAVLNVLFKYASARRSAPRFLNNAGVLEPYVEHGEQAQRSNGGPIACFDRQLVRKAPQGDLHEC